MMIRILPIFALLAGLILTYPPVTAGAQTENLANVVFDEIEKRVIRDFFGVKRTEKKKRGKKGGKSGNMPPGLAKRNSLPPGLEQQLQRFGTLPPGIAKRNLPPELAARLPKRAGVDRVIVGNDVLLVQRATGVILDILQGVLAQ